MRICSQGGGKVYSILHSHWFIVCSRQTKTAIERKALYIPFDLAILLEGFYSMSMDRHAAKMHRLCVLWLGFKHLKAKIMGLTFYQSSLTSLVPTCLSSSLICSFVILFTTECPANSFVSDYPKGLCFHR